MRRSTDQGLTFGPETLVATLNTFAELGDLGLRPFFRSNAFPQAVVNPVSGHLYVIYNDDPPGIDQADVFFTMSSDGGTTWSSPARVNSDATSNDQWQPTIAVTTDGAHLGIFWYDRRLDANNAMIDYFGRVAAISGSTVTFQPDLRISDQSFPAVFGHDEGGGPSDLGVNRVYMGDYDQAQADACNFYVTWGDNRLSTAPDIRFAKIGLCNQCPLGQGYWKNHADVWPVTSLVLGTQTYTQSELLSLLRATRPRNASMILAQQLTPALLNLANGSDPTPLGDAIDQANMLLSAFSDKLPYAVPPNSPIGLAMIHVADLLELYNTGQLTQNCLQ
jgi:hypothetical protein